MVVGDPQAGELCRGPLRIGVVGEQLDHQAPPPPGSRLRAVDEGAIIPFTEATGIAVDVEDYNGGLAEIRAQVGIGSIHWDVVSLESGQRFVDNRLCKS